MFCNHEQKLAQGYQSMSLLNLKKNHGNLNTSLGFPQSLNINLKKFSYEQQKFKQQKFRKQLFTEFITS